jgi:MFS-type transporter involved in bile tolerance (Atg22 family)
VYGLKPGSLLSTSYTVIGLCAAILMPLAGAMIDYTPHRRKMGRIGATLFCVFLFGTIFLSEDTWFMVAIFWVVIGFIAWFQVRWYG